jgi:ribonuclease D
VSQASTARIESDDLYQRLRALRALLAKRQRTSPGVLFADVTLTEIATRRPATLDELVTVRGVGPYKAERYGAAVLAVVAGVAPVTAAAPPPTKPRPPAYWRERPDPETVPIGYATIGETDGA